MNENLIQKILKEKKLRVTNVRSEILEIFEKKNYALSYNDLNEELQNKFDMATIYRTLNTFVEYKILHPVPLDAKTSYYALNSNALLDEPLQSNHVHFVCKKCSKTFCLDAVIMQNIKLNKEFKLDSLKIIVEGTCNLCSGE